jgi:murein DD-endopeptidase MepM/ murein hydrolase activator NlpD
MPRNRALIACALTLILILSVGLAMPVAGVAATRAELEAHRQKAEATRKKAAEADALARTLADEIAALDAEIESFQKQADALEPRIATATRRTNTLKREVAKLRAEAAALQADMDATQAELDTQRGLLAERVQSTYKQGTWFYLDVLLGSQDFGDLIARTELVSRVIESNNDAAAALVHTKDTLSKTKSKLDRSLQAVSLKKREAQAVESELRSLHGARKAAADKRESIQSQKSDLMADSKKNAARLRALAEEEEAESRRLEAELAGSGSGYFAGTMAWPVPSSHRITSPYGWRICPFHGRELHPGIDIGRPDPNGPSLQGAPVVAAASGSVLFAGYRGGYGNTVILDHGNGVTTLYAHLSSGSIRVSAGQSVSKGARIASVGSTGNSTGPHLHFEVRVNGVPKDPMSYR